MCSQVDSFVAENSAYYELFVLSNLETDTTAFYSSGGQVSRMQKLDELSEFPVALKYLHPCIYAAREKNTLGISSSVLLELIEKEGIPCNYFPSFDEIENFLLENCTQGDLLITMGAGDIVKVGERLLGK